MALERVDVRSMWEHEAHDFTPWLARNLDLLGDELGLNLELVQREKPVGPLFLDILAREVDSGWMVAIENQLEWSDLHHLGQLMTYAAGCDARAAVWIATEFTQECANALNRLNQWTGEDVRFYGVKVEAVRGSGTTIPEPRLLKVVYPGGWDREATLPSKPPPLPHVQSYMDFFEPVIARLIRLGFDDRPTRRFGDEDRLFNYRVDRGWGYSVSLEGKNDAWASVHIETGDKGLTKQVFDELVSQRDVIEASMDIGAETEWDWRRHDRWGFSTINLRTDGSIDDLEEDWDRTRNWMVEYLPKLRMVFDPRLGEIFWRLAGRV